MHLDGDTRGAQQRDGLLGLGGEGDLALASATLSYLGGLGEGERDELVDLRGRRGAIVLDQAPREIALERDRRQALAQQVVQVTGKPPALCVDGLLGEFGARVSSAPTTSTRRAEA